jgi:hypothetical protein
LRQVAPRSNDGFTQRTCKLLGNPARDGIHGFLHGERPAVNSRENNVFHDVPGPSSNPAAAHAGTIPAKADGTKRA